MTRRGVILLAEDHAQSVRACVEALERLGWRVVVGDNLARLPEMILQERPSVLLLDAALPGGDVLELCRGLRRRAVPVILLVPPRFDGRQLDALRPLAEECIAKPFDAEDVARRAVRLASGGGDAAYPTPGSNAGPRVREALPDDTASLGREIAGCRLERAIGRGASSVVYLARHCALDLPVAVKLMPVGLQAWDAEERRRFLRGARAAARIQHPNVVPVLNAGEEGDCFFVVQRYVDGETLLARMERTGPLPEEAVRRLTREVAAGLGAAHRLDVVHRDVKPANIILAASGEAVLADFGLARSGADRDISSASAIVGTPLYMSPEQCAGRPLDGRSDLYSLGASAYHALVGRPPITGESPVAVLRNHLEQTPDPPGRVARGVSRRFSDLLMKLLAKAPEARFQDAQELQTALAEA